MKKKRQKLRLRKQVIMCIPVALLFAILTVGIIINSHKTYANSVESNGGIASENRIVDGGVLSNNKYIVEFTKMMDKRQKDNTVIYYASKFKLNVNRALEIAHELTDNYENEDYNKNYIIAMPKYKEKIKAFDSFEAGVVHFIRNLYSYPERYGSSIEEMRLDETPTINENSVDGHIMMDNGLTFEQYVGKISDLYGLDKSLVLAIVYQESGIMTSGLFKYNNNIGGLRGYAGWMSFPTLEAGIIGHVMSVKGIIDNYELDMNQEDAIALFSGVYVRGNASLIAESWTNKVTYFKEQIDNQNLFIIDK